ncbi:MAG TPA: helix-turn-helix domain-containing protein [Pyrinomonadaceae bacterium]|jgi:transcriptional regulator with XRE-family HTH domain
MINERPEHLKKTPLPCSDTTDTARTRTQERFSDAELTDIKQAFARRFIAPFSHASNAEIARRLGLTDQTVKPYADGDRLPVGEMLLRISLESGVSVDWLLIGKGTGRIESNDIFSEEEEARIAHLAAGSGRSFNDMVRVLATAMVEAHEKI